MRVSFRTISNQLYELDLQPNDTVTSVKATLASRFGFHPKKIRLIFKAHVLNDKSTLEQAGVDGKNGFVVLHAMTVQQVQKTETENESKKENDKSIDITNRIETKDEDVKTMVESAEENINTKNVAPAVEPLPEFKRNEGMPDPPGFQKKVQQLIAMGFAEGDCENALRVALGNADRAADFLLSGQIPDMPQMISVRDVPLAENNFESIILSDDEDINDEVETDNNEGFIDDNEEEEEGMSNFIHFRDELIRHPERLKSFLQQMAEDNPAIATLIRDDPSAFLASIGFDPTDFDLSGLGKSTQYEQLMSGFNDKEQQSIHNLEKLGFDTMTIIQVFVACEKNEEETKSCLESMM